jgi:pentatricopeptide repeat protein
LAGAGALGVAFRAGVAGWTAAVAALAADGDVAGAAALVARMRASGSAAKPGGPPGVAPTVVTYTALASGLAAAGRVDAARQVFASLLAHPQLELRPTAVTYNAMVALECRAGDLAAARALVEQLRATGLGPDTVALNSLLQGLVSRADTAAGASSSVGYSRSGAAVPEEDVTQWQPMAEAEALLATMETQGPPPNAFTWATLVAGYGSRGDLPNARRLFHKACAATRAGSCPRDVAVLNAYLAACAKAGAKHDAQAAKAAAVGDKQSLDPWALKAPGRSGRSSSSSSGGAFAGQTPLAEALALLAEVTDALDATLTGGRKSPGPAGKNAASSTERLFQDKGWNEVDSGFSLFAGASRLTAADAKAATAAAKTAQAAAQAAEANGFASARIFKDKGWNQVDSGFSFFGAPFDDRPLPPPRAPSLAEALSSAAKLAQRAPKGFAPSQVTPPAAATAAAARAAVAAAVGAPDVVTFGTMIGALSRSADPGAGREAWQLWQQLRARGVVPDGRLADALLLSLAQWHAADNASGRSIASDLNWSAGSSSSSSSSSKSRKRGSGSGGEALLARRSVEAELVLLGWDPEDLVSRAEASRLAQAWKTDPTMSEAWKASGNDWQAEVEQWQREESAATGSGQWDSATGRSFQEKG